MNKTISTLILATLITHTALSALNHSSEDLSFDNSETLAVEETIELTRDERTIQYIHKNCPHIVYNVNVLNVAPRETWPGNRARATFPNNRNKRDNFEVWTEKTCNALFNARPDLFITN